MAYRILLVDDEADILEFIRYNLEKEDYEVFTASNGREAVETALRVVPHLILLDVMMPEMDGVETCREIRSHDSLRRTLIAFLTMRAPTTISPSRSMSGGCSAGSGPCSNDSTQRSEMPTGSRAAS